MTVSDPSLVSLANCGDAPASPAPRVDLAAARDARRARYELQRVAQRILRGVPHPRTGGYWRTVDCFGRVSPGGMAVRMTPAIDRASYVGVCVCGSVWVCPVCSARISELRRMEIAAAHAVHAAAGYRSLMLTLTVPHDLRDELSVLLGRRRAQGRVGLAGAIHRYRQDRQVRHVVDMLRRTGFVRATEITRGAHGWHPHYHELWLVEVDEDDRLRMLAQRELLRAWQRACCNSGLDEPNHHGVDLRWAWDVSTYLVKVGRDAGEPLDLDLRAIAQAERSRRWSAARELVAAGTKRARRGNRNPWQLLRDAGDGDADARAAFAEFARATLGQRQLVWSRGLKAALAIPERSDDELARHVDEDSYLVTVIPAARWRALLSLPWDWRPRVLELAEEGGAHAIHDFLDLLEVDPERAREYARIAQE